MWRFGPEDGCDKLRVMWQGPTRQGVEVSRALLGGRHLWEPNQSTRFLSRHHCWSGCV